MEPDLTNCVYPAYWADYLSKVAEVTRLSIDYIWTKLAYARGLQFVTVWYYRHDLLAKSMTTKLKEMSGNSIDRPL